MPHLYLRAFRHLENAGRGAGWVADIFFRPVCEVHTNCAMRASMYRRGLQAAVIADALDASARPLT